MDTQAVLKAGGVGAGVLFIFNLLSFVPCVNCLTFLGTFLVYVVVGVLAAYWMVLPRTAGSGAINGALAAGVATLVSGFIDVILKGLYAVVTGSSQFEQAFADLPANQLAAMSEAGIDLTVFTGLGIVGVFGIGAVCCGIFVLIAAGLGAIGGAIWGGMNPGEGSI